MTDEAPADVIPDPSDERVGQRNLGPISLEAENNRLRAVKSTVYVDLSEGRSLLRWTEDGAPVLACSRCGCQWWDDWFVPDAEWEQGRHGYDVLCRPCWDLLSCVDALMISERQNVGHARIVHQSGEACLVCTSEAE